MTIHEQRLRDLRRSWGALVPPDPADLVGTYESSYVGRVLRATAPRGLALVGLPQWFGKRFRVSLDDPTMLEGVNLLRAAGGPPTATLPMTAAIGPSLTDGRDAVLVGYPADARRPWRWVRDELRTWDDGVLLGMTFVDVPGLRRAPGTPFVLTRADEALG